MLLCINQIEKKIQGMKDVATRFKCLFPINLIKISGDELYQSGALLCESYFEDLSPDFLW